MWLKPGRRPTDLLRWMAFRLDVAEWHRGVEIPLRIHQIMHAFIMALRNNHIDSAPLQLAVTSLLDGRRVQAELAPCSDFLTSWCCCGVGWGGWGVGGRAYRVVYVCRGM